MPKALKTRPIMEYLKDLHRQIYIEGPINQPGEPPGGDNTSAKCGICCRVAAGRGHNMRYDRMQAWKCWRADERRSRVPIFIDFCDPCVREHKPYEIFTEFIVRRRCRRGKVATYKMDSNWRMND